MLAILALASCPRWNCLDSQYLLYLWRAEEFVRKLADYVDGLQTNESDHGPCVDDDAVSHCG